MSEHLTDHNAIIGKKRRELCEWNGKKYLPFAIKVV